jgi:FeS assembly SUF system regulator
LIRLSRLADYGIVLMTQLAVRPGVLVTAPDIALVSGIPVPTASKILKMMAQTGLLDSQRGTKGGYALVRPPEEIPVLDIIRAVDGPVGLTDCSVEEEGGCDLEALCPTRTNWRKINDAVLTALEGITLADMTPPDISFLPDGLPMAEKAVAAGE